MLIRETLFRVGGVDKVICIVYFRLLWVKMSLSKYTSELPVISYSEYSGTQRRSRTPPVHPPMNTEVVCTLRGIGHVPHWERDRLDFFPGQKYVPIVISDSMAKDVDRHPYGLKIVRHGATVAQLVKLVTHIVGEIIARLPIKRVWVVFVAGGNDICRSKLRRSSPYEIKDEVKSALVYLAEFCRDNFHKLTVGQIMPRPIEFMDDGSVDFFYTGKTLADLYFGLNNFIKDMNTANGSSQLMLGRYLYHGNRSKSAKQSSKRRRDGRGGSRRHTYRDGRSKVVEGRSKGSSDVGRRGERRIVIERRYPTGLPKIRKNRFATDGIHLNAKGSEKIKRAVWGLISELA